MNTEHLPRLYQLRFSPDERAGKDAIWKVLCEGYFQQFVSEHDTVLDIACGYGEFTRHIRAARKLAVDLNPEARACLPEEVGFYCSSAEHMPEIPTNSVSVCFTSNSMDLVLKESLRVLKPGGLFICMQPNIRYAPGEYWDFYDHVLPLSHLSAAEGFEKSGFRVEKLIPKFVPFSTKSGYPKHPFLVRNYLRFPFVWRLLGRQFVLVARSPEH